MTSPILIAEDDAVVRSSVRIFIESFANAELEVLRGHTIIEDANYLDVRRKIKERNSDFLFTLIGGKLLGGSGPQAAKALKSEVPWIGMTGTPEVWRENAERCGLEYDPDAVLRKPFGDTQLISQIKKVLKLG